MFDSTSETKQWDHLSDIGLVDALGLELRRGDADDFNGVRDAYSSVLGSNISLKNRHSNNSRGFSDFPLTMRSMGNLNKQLEAYTAGGGFRIQWQKDGTTVLARFPCQEKLDEWMDLDMHVQTRRARSACDYTQQFLTVPKENMEVWGVWDAQGNLTEGDWPVRMII